MSTASYKKVCLAAMAEVLTPLGFRKKGSQFSRESGDVRHLVALQSSASSTASVVRVTVNLGVRISSLADPDEKADLWSSHWSQRLGSLMPVRQDHWWEMSSQSGAEAAAREIAEALQQHGVPALDFLSSSLSLVELWSSGRSPGLTATQARRYLGLLEAKAKPG